MDTSEFIAWLGDRLDKIESKLDEGRDHLASVDVTLAKQAADLEYHIKRTNLLEAKTDQIASEVTPIKDHVQRIKGIGWFLSVVGVLIGVAATIRGLFK